jgi:hypothetical protein
VTAMFLVSCDFLGSGTSLRDDDGVKKILMNDL